MKKRIEAILVCILLIVSSLIIVFPVESVNVNGNTLYVGGSGLGNYTKIQDAIDASSDGDTVYVYSRTYFENVIVYKSISLVGEDRNTTVVDGGGHNDTICILSDSVNISGFMITNSGYNWYSDAGIDVHSNSNTIMYNNIVSHQENGIKIWSSYSKVYKNIISNVPKGIITNSARNNLISDNLIFKATSSGIYFAHLSQNNIAYENFIYDSNKAVEITESNCNIVCDNYAEHNDEGMFLWDCKWNVIRDNTFSNSSFASMEMNTNAFDNIIFHNNIINKLCYDLTGGNYWYREYPLGGNYWSDYFDGADDYHGPNQNLTGGDGIWDDPYIVSGSGNIDRYPFAIPNGWKDHIYGSNLECFGSLVWNSVKPGSINNNTIFIVNIGDYSSNLNWEIVEWPSWGTLTFTPSNGNNLKPEDGMTSVQVSVVAPNEPKKTYTGEIKIVNKEDSNDFRSIQVSLTTSKAKGTNIPLFLQKFFQHFPIFEKILKQYY